MTEFSIEYNPYLVESVFKKNGVEVSSKGRLGSKASKKRLQVLFGKDSNWDGLLEEIMEDCNDNKIVIHFKGRKTDFEDLQSYVEGHKDSEKFSLQLIEGKNDNDILKELDKFFEDVKGKNLPEFQERDKEGRTIFEAYEEVKNGIFNISVIATMSSGKSTLINSILHTDLLPSANKATTGTIGRIIDNDDMEGYEAVCYAADDETVIYPRSVADAETLKAYNADEKVQYIYIEGNIPGVSSDRLRLCLEDTPGPNNSRNKRHEELTREVIRRKNGVILYVMNATQFGTDDDEELLRDIAVEMKQNGKQSHDRFIFVVNKCDELDEGRGETIESLLVDVRKYLEGFDIIDPVLISTSARLALLIRKEARGEYLTRAELKDLDDVNAFVKLPELHFDNYAAVSMNVKEKIREKVEECKADASLKETEALIHTGVPVVEEVISEYIEKYALPMKINDAVQNIINILKGLNMKAKFQEGIAKDKNKLNKVRMQIQDAKHRYEEGKKIYDSYKKTIMKFGLEGMSCEEKQFKTETELQTITVDYRFIKLIDKGEAERIISDFVSKLDSYQQRCEKEINRILDISICKRGEELLEEYKKLVRDILDEIDIEDYKFSELPNFKKIEISNLEEIKRNNTQDRTHEEIRWKKNPERMGFIGRLKFWKPKEISYYVQVKDGEDVNVADVTGEIAYEFLKNIKNNIAAIFNDAEQQLKEYKDIFISNIDTLDKEIEKALLEIEESIQDEQIIAENLKRNEELYYWLQMKEEQIHRILEFNV